MADVKLSGFTIPDAYVSRAIAVCDNYANKSIRFEVGREDTIDTIEFTYPAKGESESYANFGRRVIQALFVNLMFCYENGQAEDDYRADIKAVTKDAVTVPDEALS